MTVQTWRRVLHQQPELGFLEYRTAATAAAHLHDLGFELRLGSDAMDADARLGMPDDTDSEWSAALAEGHSPKFLDPMRGGMTGVVATLTGSRPGPTVGIRFDMDALPVAEATSNHPPADHGFASKRRGLMHACGHDGHVAVGLELASRLATRDFPGTVRLFFQPAEEGLRGGRAMATHGNVADVSDMYTFHLGMGVSTGIVFGGTAGSLASTKLRATFSGEAAHAALTPEQGRNALLAAAHATLAVNALGQHGSADTRLNVGSLMAPGTSNIIPPLATLLLEVRSNRSDVCDELEAKVMRALAAAGDLFGVSCEIVTTGKAPAVECDVELVEHVVTTATRVPGVEESHPLAADSASDDASWLINAAKDRGGRGTYIVVGSTQPSGHHSERFDIDERSLDIAVDLLEELVLNPAPVQAPAAS